MKQLNGFTLIELVIAMFVLTVGLLCLISSSVMITRLVTNGDSYAEATVGAVGRLELWRGTRCGVAVASLESADDGIVSLGQQPADGAIQRATMAVTTRLARGVRVDTFSVTGGC